MNRGKSGFIMLNNQRAYVLIGFLAVFRYLKPDIMAVFRYLKPGARYIDR